MPNTIAVRHALLATVVLAAAAPEAGAAELIDVTSATRQVHAWAYGYDYEFDEGIDDFALDTQTSGAFVDDVLADLFDWYGVHVSTGVGSIESVLTTDRIQVSYDVQGEVDNSAIFTADAGGEGDFAAAFEAAALVRVAIDADIARIGEAYAVGDATLRDGEGAVVFSTYVQANPTASLSTVRWLLPGGYETEASVQAWAFGGDGTTEVARGTLELDLRFYHGADMDLDGDVDVEDLDLYLDLLEKEDDDADVNGDGDVDDDDRDLFWNAWRDATLACPGDLDGSGSVDFTDLLAMLAAWGPCAFCPADLDGNLSVDFGDLVTLLANWGDCDT